jgi:two-component system, response regulator PdtaR
MRMHLGSSNSGRGVMSTPQSVLVVEDEPLLLMDIVDHLRGQGFIVFEAGNADDAIAILEINLDIFLVFTDIDIPGSMDGLRLAAAVRDRWPPVKIIVTSGHRMIEVTDLPDGSLFFSKPYMPAQIVSSIREMLSGA